MLLLYALQSRVNLTVGVDNIAQIATEAVFVQPLVGLDIPKSAGVGANLVGKDNLAVGCATKLNLKVDKIDTDTLKEDGQHLVKFCSGLVYVVELFVCHQIQCNGVVVVDKRVAKCVVLVADVKDYILWF